MKKLVVVGVILLGLVGLGLVLRELFFTKPPATVIDKVPDATAFSHTPLSKVDAPTIQFRDVTSNAGVNFRHVHGGFGMKLMPETIGAGLAVFDFNRDGHQDLLFVNSGYWPHHMYETTAAPVHPVLYLNDGKGQFRDVSVEAGLAKVNGYGMGVTAGDVDNDGFQDVVITCLGRCHLLHNEGGKTFTDVTEAAGLQCPGWSSSAAFVDYDLDGKLDLVIAHYVKWTPETDLFCKLIGNEKSYCQPMLYEGEHCQLLRNLGGNKFEDVSAKAGIQVMDYRGVMPAAKALGVAIHDYNDDGWPDVAIANDTTPNFLFHNNGNGTFTNVARNKGVELLNDPPRSTARGAMGIHWGYYRDGETLGLAIANFANEPNGLLRYSKQRDMFRDCAMADGIDGPSRLPLKFGLFFFDYDLDGRLDLFTSNGHIEPEIERTQVGVKYAQPAQLFWNAGATKDGCYREIEPRHAGQDLFKPRVGRGCAYGDIDGDGDLDVVLNNNNQPANVFTNECPTTVNAIRIKFQGKTANRDGYGCRVKLWSESTMHQAELNSGGSYLSQSEAVLTFGLGNRTKIEKVEVRWPTKDGKSTKLENLAPGFTYVIAEDEGVVAKTPFQR